jgi:hypothetical protein
MIAKFIGAPFTRSSFAPRRNRSLHTALRRIPFAVMIAKFIGAPFTRCSLFI